MYVSTELQLRFRSESHRVLNSVMDVTEFAVLKLFVVGILGECDGFCAFCRENPPPQRPASDA